MLQVSAQITQAINCLGTSYIHVLITVCSVTGLVGEGVVKSMGGHYTHF